MIIIIYILFTILWLSKGIKKSKGIKVYYDYHSLNILWLPTGDIKSPLAMPITMVIVMRLHPIFLLVCFWFSLYWICHLCWFYKISLALMKYIYISLNHQFFFFLLIQGIQYINFVGLIKISPNHQTLSSSEIIVCAKGESYLAQWPNNIF